MADGGWGWGAVAIDADHDGWVDIVETNGITNDEFCREPSYVFRNEMGDGGPGFCRKLGSEVGIDEGGGQLQGRGLINFDYDNDGDQDILIVYNNNIAGACPTGIVDNVRIFRNEIVETGTNVNWLRVKVNTCGHSKLAPNGFGTRVIATVGGNTYYRSIDGGCNYLSQSELTAHFGIGASVLIDELRVEWPMPVTFDAQCNAVVKYTTLTNVAVNQTITVPALGDMNCDGLVNNFDIDPFLDALFDPATYDANNPNCIILNGDVDGSGTVDSFDIEGFLDCVGAGGCVCP